MMTAPPERCLAIMLTLLAAGWWARPQAVGKNSSGSGPTRTLATTCLITNDVTRLVEFYEPVLGIKAKRTAQDYAEFPTSGGALAIFSAAAQEKYIPGSAEGGKNKSVVLEFRVANVDQEYQRLQILVKTWVKAPTTQPWGTRSTYFRDPDGNLVNFYVVVKQQ
jgi:uncharacterized glyoxalase superfamily protein PhnB